MFFWSGYIDPFLEALAIQEIANAVSMARGRSIDARLLLPEVQGLLIAASRKVFAQMTEVDRRLRGNGSTQLRTAEKEMQRMSEFIEEHIRCELSMWKPKSKVEQWFQRNKFLAWLITTMLAIVGLCVGFFR